MSDVETSTHPPFTEDDEGEDLPSARIGLSWIAVDDRSTDAAVQLFGEQANDPEEFAGALLRAALGLAATIGPAHHWAAIQRLAAFDGTS